MNFHPLPLSFLHFHSINDPLSPQTSQTFFFISTNFFFPLSLYIFTIEHEKVEEWEERERCGTWLKWDSSMCASMYTKKSKIFAIVIHSHIRVCFSTWWMCGTCYTLSHFIPSLLLALVIGIEKRKEGNFLYVRALTTKFLLKMSEIFYFFIFLCWLCVHMEMRKSFFAFMRGMEIIFVMRNENIELSWGFLGLN